MPKESFPGLSLACLTTSPNVLNGEAAFATSQAGWTETMAIGTKSIRGSFPVIIGAMVSGAVVVKNRVLPSLGALAAAVTPIWPAPPARFSIVNDWPR